MKKCTPGPECYSQTPVTRPWTADSLNHHGKSEGYPLGTKVNRLPQWQ